MIKNKKLLLTLTLSGLATISAIKPAFALMSIPCGWFLEANGGSSNLSNKSYGAGQEKSSSGLGGNANAGYKFMPFLAVEIGYSRYPNITIRDQYNVTAAKDKFYSYDLAARGILPISNSGFEAFAKIGAGHIVSSVTIKNQQAANNIALGSSHHSNTNVYLGLGAQWYFYPEIAVVAQWQRANGSSGTGTLDLLTLGLSFIFN